MDIVANNKRIAKNTLFLYFRMLIIMGITLYTSRVVLSVLGVKDYGIYNVVGGVVAMFSFLNTSMAISTQRFLSYELGLRDHSQLQKIFSTSINIHIGIAFVILLLSETVGLYFLDTYLNIPSNRLSAAHWIFHFSVLSFIVSVIQTPFNAVIMAHERMNVYAYISILEVLLKLLIVFILLWTDVDKLKLYALLIFCVTLIIGVMYIFYSVYSFSTCKYRFVFDKTLFVSILGFSSWNLLGALSVVLMSQGGNILLNIFFGPIVNASRGIAYQINAAINSFVYNFQSAINPQIVKFYAAGEQSYLMHLVYRGSRLSYFLLFVISFPILFYTNYVLKLWLGDVPEYAVIFCRLVIITALIDSLSGCMAVLAQATGSVRKYQIMISSLLLLNIPISYLGLKLYANPELVFYVGMFISLLAFFLRAFLLVKICSFHFKEFIYNILRRVLNVSIISFSIFISIFCICNNTLIHFLTFTFFSFIVNIILIFFLGMENDEKKFVLHKVFLFFKR